MISAMSILTPAFQTLDRKSEIEPDVPENTHHGRIEGTAEFQIIKFKYPSRPEVTVLKNFTLKIEAGTKVGLVGPSGAGKSSILALLLRFYDPMEGKVVIDGKDIKEYNLRWLRTRIGFVQQEPILISSSIRENIRYGNCGTSLPHWCFSCSIFEPPPTPVQRAASIGPANTSKASAPSKPFSKASNHQSLTPSAKYTPRWTHSCRTTAPRRLR